MGNKTMILAKVTGRTIPKQRMGTLAASCSVKEFPLEVAMLLDVLARIEARRQARLRAEERG